MKLKTLKDFIVNPKSWAGAMANCGRKYTIDIEELKQEAIKHIKSTEDEKIVDDNGDIFDNPNWRADTKMMEDFFNITEEDLK